MFYSLYGYLFQKSSSDRGWKMPHLMLVIVSKVQMACLFPWETDSLHWVGIPKILLLLKFMDLSHKLSVSELIVLTHAVEPGVPNVSGRGDERLRYGDSSPWRGKDWLGISAFTPRRACLVFHPICSTYLCLYIHWWFLLSLGSFYLCMYHKIRKPLTCWQEYEVCEQKNKYGKLEEVIKVLSASYDSSERSHFFNSSNSPNPQNCTLCQDHYDDFYTSRPRCLLFLHYDISVSWEKR